MPVLSDKVILRRFARAKTARAPWDATLREAYHYALSQYKFQGVKTSTSSSAADGKGESRGADIYDSTASDALNDRAERTRGLLFPKGRQWLFVRPEAAKANANVARMAEHVFNLVQAAFEVSNIQTEAHQAIRESYISIGGLALDVGVDHNPLSFEALPVSQIIPEEAADGTIRSNFREYSLAAYELETRLPDVTAWPEDIAAAIAEGKDEMIGFIEAQIFDPSTGQTNYSLFIKKGHVKVLAKTYDVGRLIVFRVDKVPGETMGRGPVLRTLPDIKTANKVVELILRNASIAVTGIWQADDDGVLNPANIKLVPGTIIPKAVGSRGLTPLEAPGRFDVSQLVLHDLQDKIRRTIFGPALPPVSGGVRSATEINQRTADMSAVEIPSLDRLEGELFRQMIRRAMFVLSDPQLAASSYYLAPQNGIDRLDFIDAMMEVLETPSERAKRQIEAREQLAALEHAVKVDPAAAKVIKIEDYWSYYFKAIGFDNSLIKSADELQVEAEKARQAAIAQQMAQLAAQAGNSPANSNTPPSPAAFPSPPSPTPATAPTGGPNG